MDRSAHRRVVGALHGAADLAEPERAQGVALLRVRAVHGAQLRNRELRGLRHQEASAGAGSVAPSSAASWPAPPSSPSPSRLGMPSTSRTVRPRSSATSFGLRRFSSAVIVAFTRLIGFWLPSDFESTSWMPASSSTARTPPPAITPVPSEAGLRNTRPAPYTPSTWWVIVVPYIGTLKRFFLARSTPFWMASGTSLALP